MSAGKMNTTCPTTNDSTTMATKKQTLTFKLNYTVTKHYELKEKYDFEQFKGRFFNEDNESIKYAQAVWDRLQALNKKGVVRLDDEDEDEDGDDDDYYERVGESADDHISDIVKEMQKKDPEDLRKKMIDRYCSGTL